MTIDITLQDILGTAPCYGEDHIRELWAEHAGERESIKPSEIVGVVPDRDAMWALCRLAPESLAREAACDWAERALQLAGVTDERSWRAIEVARRYARGEATQDELDAAWHVAKIAARATGTAWAAAWATRAATEAAGAAADAAWAAADAAWAAARTAAWAAVWEAACDAGWEAACDAGWEAAWYAARAAAMRGMLLDLVERMEGGCCPACHSTDPSARSVSAVSDWVDRGKGGR